MMRLLTGGPGGSARGRRLATGALLIVGCWFAALAMLPVWPVQAQAPEKERRFVYGLNLFDGTTYATGFAPPAVDTVYLLADHVAVLDPKLTEVYFWPITNDYRADFTSLNQLVPGRLEVLSGGQVVQTVDLAPYVVQLDTAGALGGGLVAVGDAAAERWAQFQAARTAYLAQLQAYADSVAAYGRQVDALQGMTGAGSAAATLAPPVEPPAFTLYSSETAQGFPIRLPAGEYAVRVRDGEGRVVPDSEKRLVLFGPRRAGVSVEVVPQERWTFPAQAGDPADVIYTTAGGVVYLRPSAAQEFNAEAFTRLRNPQDQSGAPNRWQWVPAGPLPPGTLVVEAGGQSSAVPLTDFLVEQVPGAALGYAVVPVAERVGAISPNRAPDLTAYRVAAPASRGAVHVRLQDAAGADIAGSARTVVAVASVPLWQLALPVVVPLAVGLSVVLWRREQVQTARSLTAEQRRRIA